MKQRMLMMALAFLIMGFGSAGALEKEGEIREEPDRGTVRLPDFVAVPHAEEVGPLDQMDRRLSKTPNKSLATDENRDGLISRNEWKGTVDDFTRLDANEDQVLSQRELDSYVQIGVDKFAAMDINRDGILTKNEWKEASNFFRKLDRDKNGALSRREYYFDTRETGDTLTNIDWEQQ